MNPSLVLSTFFLLLCKWYLYIYYLHLSFVSGISIQGGIVKKYCSLLLQKTQ